MNYKMLINIVLLSQVKSKSRFSRHCERAIYRFRHQSEVKNRNFKMKQCWYSKWYSWFYYSVETRWCFLHKAKLCLDDVWHPILHQSLQARKKWTMQETSRNRRWSLRGWISLSSRQGWNQSLLRFAFRRDSHKFWHRKVTILEFCYKLPTF